MRNLALARLLGLEDYGLAITLSILLAAVEMTTSLGLPQLCVSHRRGGQHPFQAALHGVQILRGLFGAALLLAMSVPLAKALHMPEQLGLLQTMALVPLLLGFCHLDAFRAQRLQRHRPQMLLLVGPSAVVLLALWPLSRIIAGPQVMGWLLALHAIMTLTASHALATRRYRVRIDRSVILLALRYGLPVAANGVLMFAVLHLEKLIAGQALGLGALALVAMGATLTMTPALILARSFQAFYLPLLRAGASPADARARALSLGCFIGAGCAIGTALLCPLVLPLLGPTFAPLGPLLALFAVIAALRLPKSALATIALADGRTALPALANLPRLLIAPIIWWSLASGGGLLAMLGLALAAETCGLLLGLFLLRAAPKVLPLAVLATCCTLVMAGYAGVAAALWLVFWLIARTRPLATIQARAA